MIYLSKTYKDFLPQPIEIVNELKENSPAWVAEKVNFLRKKIARLRQELSTERDPNIIKRKRMEVKVAELKIMIARIK